MAIAPVENKSNIALDVVNQTLVVGDQHTQLTPKAFAVLNHLHQHSGQLVSKNELLETVWPRVYVGDAVLKVAVREIRKALNDDPREPQFIKTVHRRGYRFIGRLASTEPLSREEITAPLSFAPIRTALSGRDKEIAALSRHWQEALQGRSQLVFINGLAGVGKSSLAETWLQHNMTMSDGFYAKGYCLEQQAAAEAYLPILDALGRMARSADSGTFKRVLMQYAPGWLWQLPWLLGEAERNRLQQQLIGSTPQRMLREMAEFLDALSAEQPLLILLEDLHWCDLATLDLLRYFAQRGETSAARCMIIATTDPGRLAERSHPLLRMQRELVSLPGCQVLELGMLPLSACQDYLQQRCPGLDGTIAQALYQRSDGHPLFVAAAIDALIADGIIVQEQGTWRLAATIDAIDITLPEQLQHIIEQQLDRLDQSERRVLDAASVVRHWFAAEAIAAMLDRDIIDIETICEDLVWRGAWLQDADSREWPDGTLSALYGFRNALYRAYVYQQLPSARRRRLHQRLAQRLERAYQGQHKTIAVDLAYHFERGGDKRKAILFCRLAAEVDCARFAPREALQHIKQALSLSDARLQPVRDELLLQYGELLAASGQMQEAIEAYRSLAQTAEQTELQIKALLGLASTLFWFDRKQCLSVAEQAHNRSQQVDNAVLKAHVDGRCAHWRTLIQGYRPENDAAYLNAVTVTEKAGATAWHCQHLALLAYLQTLHTNYQESARTAANGLELALAVGDGQHYLACQFFRAWALFYAGCWGEMLAVMEDGFTIASKNGHLPWVAHFQLQQAWLGLHLNDYPQAQTLSQPIVDHSCQNGFFGSEFFLGSIILARAHLGQQQLEAVGRCLDAVQQRLEQVPESIDWILRLPLQQALADYHIACASWSDAQAAAQILLELAAGPGEQTYSGFALMQQAYCEQARGHDASAIEFLQQAAERVANAPTVAWQIHLGLAECYKTDDHMAKAQREAALSILKRLSTSLSDYPQQRRQFLQALEMTYGIHV